MNEENTIEEYQESVALPQEQSGSRIGFVAAFLLIFFGVIIDLIQLLLLSLIIGVVLNYIIGFGTWLTFFLFLRFRGISMWESRIGMKILMGFLVSMGLELLTLGAAPGWGLWALTIVIAESSRSAPIIGKIAKK